MSDEDDLHFPERVATFLAGVLTPEIERVESRADPAKDHELRGLRLAERMLIALAVRRIAHVADDTPAERVH